MASSGSSWFHDQMQRFQEMRLKPPKADRKFNRKLKQIAARVKRAKRKYREYLQTPRWKAFRLQIINERGAQCEMCGTMAKVQLHHLNYERLGRELDIDVQLLCRTCHLMVHDRLQDPQ